MILCPCLGAFILLEHNHGFSHVTSNEMIKFTWLVLALFFFRQVLSWPGEKRQVVEFRAFTDVLHLWYFDN